MGRNRDETIPLDAGQVFRDLRIGVGVIRDDVELVGETTRHIEFHTSTVGLSDRPAERRARDHGCDVLLGQVEERHGGVDSAAEEFGFYSGLPLPGSLRIERTAPR